MTGFEIFGSDLYPMTGSTFLVDDRGTATTDEIAERAPAR